MRLLTVFWLVVLSVGLLIGCDQEKTPPSTRPLPDFQRMPMRLGKWNGQDTPLSPEIIAALEVDEVIDRVYRHADKSHIIISSHIATFSDLDKGFDNHPKRCYLADGWTPTDDSIESIYTGEGRNIRAGLSKWEKEQNAVLVLYWYQLGDEILLEKSDLDRVRSRFVDCDQSPKLLKVQLQIDAESGKSALLLLSAEIARWIDNPSYDSEKSVPF